MFARCLFSIVLLAITLAATPSPTIVTLVPSLGDDAFAIGAHVVGVSKFTTLPATSNAQIVADFQSVDVERVVALHPSAVIGIPAQARFAGPLRAAGIRVILIPDDSFEDIFRDLDEVGRVAGRAAQATALGQRLRAQTERLRRRAPAHRPTVFVALGTGPIWTAGPHSYLDRLIDYAGGRNAASDLRAPWGEYSEEALLRAQPDAILAGHDTDVRSVSTREPWRSLHAVRSGHVFVVPEGRIANALYRPGPDYNEGLRWLIERLSSLSISTIRPDHSNPSSSNSKH